MLILAVGIGIVFCIIVFICYSYKQNQRSKYTSEVYKVFKGQYGRGSVISMGYAQTNAFTDPVTLMLAVSKDDHRVVDAWEVTQEEMENSCRSCEEYIGMDLIKYYKENQERIEKSQMMNQTVGRDSAKKKAFDMAVQQSRSYSERRCQRRKGGSKYGRNQKRNHRESDLGCGC